MQAVQQFFNGLVENIFHSDLGICNIEATEYFSELLCSYIHTDDLYPFKQNKKIISVDKLLEKISSKEQRRNFYRYVGDFTVFWSGVYPENIKNLQGTGLGFSRDDFIKRGKEFYLMASKIQSKENLPSSA